MATNDEFAGGSASGLSSEEQARIEAVGEQLRDKIASKFQVSALLAGFGFTLLGLEISLAWQSSDSPALLGPATGLVAAGVLLFVLGLVHLDGLTMPKRFWQEDRSNRDPRASRRAYLTDKDLWGVRDRMIFYWSRYTVVATGLMGVGLCAAVFPLPASAASSARETIGLWILGCLVATGIYVVLTRHLESRRFRDPLLRPAD